MDNVSRRDALKFTSFGGALAFAGAVKGDMAFDDGSHGGGQDTSKGDGVKRSRPGKRVEVDLVNPKNILYKDRYSISLGTPSEEQQVPQVVTFGIGTEVRHWFGDQLPIAGGAGEIPAGYVKSPLFKQWIKGTHPAGYFSYGPYDPIRGVGQFRVQWFMSATNRGGADENAFTGDIADFDAEKQLVSTTFKVGQLPPGSDGFIVHSPYVEIPTNHRIETRIIAHGGASLSLYSLRWYIETL